MLACGKLRYKDELAAKLALVSTRRKDSKRPKSEVRAYLCPACRGWHLTSMKRADREAPPAG